MDSDALSSELRSLLARYGRRTPDSITDADHMLFDLAVNQDDVAFDLIPELERRFKFHASREEWSQVATVGDLRALVGRLRGQSQPEVLRERVETRQLARRQVAKIAAGVLAYLGTAVALYFSARPAFIVWIVSGSSIVAIGALVAGFRQTTRFRAARRVWKLAREKTSGA